MPLGFEAARQLATRGLRTLASLEDRVGEGAEIKVQPFAPGDFSPGAEVAKLGTALIAEARSRANQRAARAKMRADKEYQDLRMQELKARLAPKPTYGLQVPGLPLPSGIEGPPAPETITFDDPNQYATQRRQYYPAAEAPKGETPITPYQAASLSLRERALALSASRAKSAGGERSKLAAINATEVSNRREMDEAVQPMARDYGRVVVSKLVTAAQAGDEKALIDMGIEPEWYMDPLTTPLQRKGAIEQAAKGLVEKFTGRPRAAQVPMRKKIAKLRVQREGLAGLEPEPDVVAQDAALSDDEAYQLYLEAQQGR